MNHLRNICANKKLMCISNHTEIMFDTSNAEDLVEMKEMLQANKQEFEATEVQTVPSSLKTEYFNAVTG